MITGKCKKDFKKWFLLSNNRELFSANLRLGDIITVAFYKFPFSMQYGVYVDFFDSVEITIAYAMFGDYPEFRVIINGRSYGEWEKTRHEARTEAINKANEIYNEKHSN